MPINWQIVKREHVLKACDLILSGTLERRLRGRGLFVMFRGHRLPAKDVARVAYLVARGMRPDGYLDFSSGQRTLDLFKDLGFEVERAARSQLARAQGQKNSRE